MMSTCDAGRTVGYRQALRGIPVAAPWPCVLPEGHDGPHETILDGKPFQFETVHLAQAPRHVPPPHAYTYPGLWCEYPRCWGYNEDDPVHTRPLGESHECGCIDCGIAPEWKP